jgi:hypothetical protein
MGNVSELLINVVILTVPKLLMALTKRYVVGFPLEARDTSLVRPPAEAGPNPVV